MFDDFLQELAKPSWWIGVVFVSFLINLASAYAKPLIDKLLGRFWLSSKQAAERRQAVITERAKELLTAPQLVVELKLDILTDTLHAVMIASWAIICFLMIVLSQNETLTPILTFPFKPKNAVEPGNMLLLILGGFLFSFASITFTKSFDKERILRAYKKLKKEAESPET